MTDDERSEDGGGVQAAIAPLPLAYHGLLDKIIERLHEDERVVALWLSGSLGRGAADGSSDLDLIVTVRSDRDGFLEGHPVVDEVIRSIITVPVSPYIRAFMTSDCLRVDLVVEEEAELAESPFRSRVLVYGPDGIAARLPAPALGRGPDPGRLLRLVTDSYREIAIFPALFPRADWLLGRVGVTMLHQRLYDLLVETNQPLPPMGVKQWSRRLTPVQRDLLGGLPLPAEAEREPVVAAMATAVRAFRTDVRAAVEAVGVTWPDELDTAITAAWVRAGLPEL